MNSLVLHFGISKTGTSTLQRALFQRHSQVQFLGKYVPSRTPKGCISKEVYDVLKPLLWEINLELNLEKQRDALADIMAHGAPEKNVTVCSWETLGMSRHSSFKRRLERIAEVSNDTKLMMTLRNPIYWLPSLYLQEIQGHYAKRNRKHFGNRAYLDFETWLNKNEKHRGSISNWLVYANNIQQAVEILGKQNVGVFLFEDLRSNPTQFYRSIADFIGIDADECLKLTNDSHYNVRLLQADMEYIQKIDSSLISRLRWRFSTNKERRQRLRQHSDSARNYSDPARLKLSDEWIETISAATREGHHYLRQELGLDVELHGYPM